MRPRPGHDFGEEPIGHLMLRRRAWFLLYIEAANTCSSSGKSTNPRNIMSVCSRAQSFQSDRTVYSARSTVPFSSVSGGIEGTPPSA